MKKYIVWTILFISVWFYLIYFTPAFFLHANEPGTSLFFYYATRLANGEIPYHDFMFEYPPLALLFMTLPRFFTSNFDVYQTLFWIQNGIFGLLGLWMTIDLTRGKWKEYLIPSLYILLFIIFGSLNLFRYDLIPASLTLGAVWLKIKNRPGWAWFILGLAVMTKIYPAVLAPLFFIEDWKKWRQIWVGLVGFLAGLAIPLLPLVPVLNDLKKFITYQGDRGAQIESTWANGLILQHLITKNSLHVIEEAAAIGLAPYPRIMTPISSIVLLIGFATIYIVFVYRRQKLLLFSFLAVLFFILVNRIFSPQYMIWLIVFFPLALGEIKSFKIIIPTTVLFLIALYITKLIYPHLYLDEGLLDFKNYSVALLTVRNLSLLIIFVLLLSYEFLSSIKFQNKSISNQ